MQDRGKNKQLEELRYQVERLTEQLTWATNERDVALSQLAKVRARLRVAMANHGECITVIEQLTVERDQARREHE